MLRADRAEFVHITRVVGVARIAVKRDRVDQVEFPLGLHQADKVVRVIQFVRERQRPHLALGLQLAHHGRGADIEVDVGRHGGGAVVVEIGLVPNFPLVHAVLVALDQGATPTVPCRERLG